MGPDRAPPDPFLASGAPGTPPCADDRPDPRHRRASVSAAIRRPPRCAASTSTAAGWGRAPCSAVSRALTPTATAMPPRRWPAGRPPLLCERFLDLDVTQVRVAPGAVRPAMAAVAVDLLRPPVPLDDHGRGHRHQRQDHGDPPGRARSWSASGIATGVIGTLDGARTTPEAPVLQRLLAELRDGGRRAVAMEVSSHGLAQHRVDGIVFDVAAFTNLSRDHLDHHGTMEEYFEAKAGLFEPARDQGGGGQRRRPLGPPAWPSRSTADRVVTGAAVPTPPTSPCRSGSSSFRWRGRSVTVPLSGMFNVDNALVAAAVGHVTGRRRGPDRRGAGRRRRRSQGGWRWCRRDHPFAVVVDYAHTPAGLDGGPGGGRATGRRSGRVICVFGCGGDRDQGKRPEMGAVASTRVRRGGADLGQPAVGGPGGHHRPDPGRGSAAPAEVVVEPDRAAAIATAVGRWPARRRRRRGRQGPRDHPGPWPTRWCPSTTGSRPGGPWPTAVRHRRARHRPVISLMTVGRRRPVGGRAVDAGPHPVAAQEQHRPADPRGRSPGPHRQGRHADHGRHRHRRRGGHRLPGGPRRARGDVLAVGGPGHAGPRRGGADRLRRRLDQGPPPPEPGAQQAGQVRRPDRPRASSSRCWPCTGPTPSTTLSFTRYDSIGLHMGTGLWVVWATVIIAALGQRGQPDRRPRRPGRRVVDLLLRLPGHHRLLAVPPLRHLPRGRRPRPGPGLGGPGRRLPRLPVVERGAGQDLHGRHRLAVHRVGPGRPVPADEPRPAAGGHRRACSSS